eukprot:g5180.t1
MKFYMCILALAFFRVPLIQGRVTNAVADALEDRPWPRKRSSVTKVDDDDGGAGGERGKLSEVPKTTPPASPEVKTLGPRTSGVVANDEGDDDERATTTTTTTTMAASTVAPPAPEREAFCAAKEAEDDDDDDDDVDRSLDALSESFGLGFYSLSETSLSVDEIRDLLRDGNATIRNIVAKNREAERVFCDCSPSLFDWINLQTEDHKRLLNAQECAVARSSMMSSKGDIKSVRDLGWDWLDLVVRNGECFALFTRFVVEEIVRHAGKGRDPVEEARERTRRAEMKDSVKAKHLFGAILKKGGNLLGLDKEKHDQGDHDSILIAWHRVPAFSCTSVYDFRAVERCLDRVGKFFAASAAALFKTFRSQDGGRRRALVHVAVCMGAEPHITERECIEVAPHLLRQLPESFDERYFVHGINMLLESEHAHTLTCALRFLYEYLPLLSDSLRMQIMQHILEQKVSGTNGVVESIFVKLFCSWHDDVRRVFQHIIAYRMFRVKRTYLALISDKILVGSSDSRHVFLVETPPEVVSQSHYLANDTRLAFVLDFFIEQIVDPKRVVKMRRRAKAFRSPGSPPPPPKPKRDTVDGRASKSGDSRGRSKSKQQPFLFKETLYVYGKKSLAEYTRILVGYYTRALASSDGLVDSVDMAEIVFGGAGLRRGCD